MKKYSGNMMAYLSETTKSAVSDSPKIELIDFHKLIPNARNFYGIREVEQLAASMALSGQIEPLSVVHKGNGTYDIISGERRYRAVTLRYERGEITDPRVPCLCREPFQAKGNLTAEMQENVAIVCANSYREKTALEKLEEVNVLEPVAKVYFDDGVANGTISGSFRSYFAEQFLGMSSSSLQRILVLRKLCPEAVAALKDGKISDTLAAELAGRDPADQAAYIARLNNGEAAGTVRELRDEIRVTIQPIQKEAADNPGWQEKLKKIQERRKENTESKMDSSSHENETTQSYEEELEDQGQQKLISPVEAAPAEEKKNPALSTTEARRAADEWVFDGLVDMMHSAEARMAEAKEKDNHKEYVQWDLRRAAAAVAAESVIA